jgi:predicted DNA-binding transcriptional regulator AlpA
MVRLMSSRRHSLSDLPGWPALLSAAQAAAYCGMPPESFAACVDAGHFPKPVNLPIKRRLWSRAAIDAALAQVASEDRRRLTQSITDRIVQDIVAECSLTPAERKARREDERRAHAERAAAQARASRKPTKHRLPVPAV